MEEKILIRENSIGITYVVGEIHESHYEKIIETLLGIPEDEVLGIDDRGNTRFLFEISSKGRYEHICESYTGKDIPLGNNCIIQVDDISSRGTRIEISDVPFAITNDQLKIILQKYGKIYKCKNYYRKFGKYSDLKKTGDRIIWMELKEQIPQTLKINRTESIMYVQYPDQPRSCNNCGHTGHKMRYCNQNTKEFRNAIDINESGIIGIENERKKTDEEGNDDGDDDEDDADDNEDTDYDTINNDTNIDENEMNKCK